MSELQEALAEVEEHEFLAYDAQRRDVAERMRRHLARGDAETFADLALAVSEPGGNWSAHYLGIGSRARSASKAEALLELGRALMRCPPREVPRVIDSAALPYVGLAVGTEIACDLRPDECWVCNRRTIFGLFLVQQDGDVRRAREVYRLTATQEDGGVSEAVRRRFYADMEAALRQLALAGASALASGGLEPPAADYVWADALSAVMHELRDQW